jgi:mannose-6-phosphate isomerase-like protein (cupin superfamily)
MQHANEKDLEYRDGDSGVKYLMRGPKIDWGVVLLLPDQTLGQHYHREVEETFYVVEGAATFVVNGSQIPAGVGDVFRMEATDQHDIINDSGAPVKLVFIKCPYLPKDKVNC